MSSIQRYDAWPQEWPFEDEHGDLVTYEDHRKIVEELEAKLAKAVSFTSDVAYRATTIEHDRDEMWLLDLDVLRHERDCDITQARTTLAELKGQDDGN